jgi:hypothetical protein
MNYVDHSELVQQASEAKSEQLASGLAGGAAAGAVLALIFAPAPAMIIAGSAISSVLGGFITRKLMAGR